MGDRDRFGITGVVRIVEATVSRPGEGHGWHLHIHALVFAEGALEVGLVEDWQERLGMHLGCEGEWLARQVLGARVMERWCGAVVRAGGRMPGAAACDLRTVNDGAAEYVGSYLAKSTYEVAARIGAELAAGSVTKESDHRNLTPFALLASAIESESFGFRTPLQWVIESGPRLVDKATGEITDLQPPPLWRLWLAWEQASKGHHQMDWSRRPRSIRCDRDRLWASILAARGRSADESDEDLAYGDHRDGTLGEIPRSAWYGHMVWHPSKIVAALEAAESGGSVELAAWMAAEGIEYEPR